MRMRRALLFCTAVLAALGGCKPKTETLSLLVWEGYADPSFLQPFEQSHNCKVVAAYMGSSDELVAKLRGGSASNYDVISPSSDVATSIVHAGLAAPLDLSQIPSYNQLSSRLRDSPLVKDKGQVYGVPFVWGPNPLLYDTLDHGFFKVNRATELILRAWESKKPFAFNGKYTKLPKVNIWPRPIQKKPPVWIPGAGSASTWEYVARNKHCYCFVSFFGRKMAQNVLDGYWAFNDQYGLDRNPYRAGFNQVCVVGETDESCERENAKHIEYFYKRSLHVPEHYWALPGYQDYPSLEKTVRSGVLAKMTEKLAQFKTYKYKDFVNDEMIIAGGPETVRDRLIDLSKRLRVGDAVGFNAAGTDKEEHRHFHEQGVAAAARCLGR